MVGQIDLDAGGCRLRHMPPTRSDRVGGGVIVAFLQIGAANLYVLVLDLASTETGSCVNYNGLSLIHI